MFQLFGKYRDMALAVKNPCHLNMAACLIKLKRYEEAIVQCSIVSTQFHGHISLECKNIFHLWFRQILKNLESYLEIKLELAYLFHKTTFSSVFLTWMEKTGVFF